MMRHARSSQGVSTWAMYLLIATAWTIGRDAAALARITLEPTAHWGGAATAVTSDGDFVYAGIGPRLFAFDVSAPLQPVVVGNLEVGAGPVNDIKVARSYAFTVSFGAGFQVIDVWDPSAPVRVGGEANLWGYSLALSARHAYIAGGDLTVVNIQNPASPVVVANYATPGIASDVVLSGKRAYVADGEAGLQIFDISNPATPILLGSYDDDTIQYAVCVAISGNYVYLGDDQYRGIHLIDISDPAAPQRIASCAVDRIGQMTIDAETLYAAAPDCVYVIDISNPTILNCPSSCIGLFGPGVGPSPGYRHGLCVVANHAYVAADWKGLLVANVSDPLAATFSVGYGNTMGAAEAVAISGNRLYAADYLGGLQVIDISNQDEPFRTAGWIEEPGLFSCLAIAGSTAYLGSYWQALYLIDISDPLHLAKISRFDTAGQLHDIAIENNYNDITAYLAVGEQGLEIVDVSNAERPVRLGRYQTPGAAVAVAVHRGYAYVAESTGDLQIIDAWDPTHPVHIATYHSNETVWSVTVVGRYVYVGCSYGIEIVDVSDPVCPIHVATCDTMGAAIDIVTSGPYAFVALVNGSRSLEVFDVSNPRSPLLLAERDRAWDGLWSLAVSGNRIYGSSGSPGGLSVFRWYTPADFDRDGDVDQNDLQAFETCASGPAIPYTDGCVGKDFDTDGDVDQVDFGIFQRCYSGANVPADPNCAN